MKIIVRRLVSSCCTSLSNGKDGDRTHGMRNRVVIVVRVSLGRTSHQANNSHSRTKCYIAASLARVPSDPVKTYLIPVVSSWVAHTPPPAAAKA